MEELKDGFKEMIDSLKSIEINDKEVDDRQKRIDSIRLQNEKHIKTELVCSFFGKRYMDATFDTYKTIDEVQAKVKQKCIRYSKMDKSKGEGLFLCGNSGTGKNHLMAAICKELNSDFILIKFEKLCEMKRMAQVNNKNWTKEIEMYCKASMLVIPDLIIRQDKQTKEFTLTDSQKELFIYVIDERYNNFLPVMIATNMKIEKLKQAVDFFGTSRIIDRFQEMFGAERTLFLNWQSYRKI